MNTQGRMSKWMRVGMVVMAALTIVAALPVKEAKANPCSCVQYVAIKLYGKIKDIPYKDFRDTPHDMAIDANGNLARTGQSSVYWSYTKGMDGTNYPYRYNAGWAQAGDVVIFLKNQPLYLRDSADQWVEVGKQLPVGGHIGIVLNARYFAPGEDASPIKKNGGWEVMVEHANWSPCTVRTDTFFVPNGTATGWWRE